MAPSTPPPPSSELLAALTMASTVRRVISPRWALIFTFFAISATPGGNYFLRTSIPSKEECELITFHLCPSRTKTYVTRYRETNGFPSFRPCKDSLSLTTALSAATTTRLSSADDESNLNG